MSNSYDQASAIRQSITDLERERKITKHPQINAELLARIGLLEEAILTIERYQNLRVAMMQVIDHK